MFNRRKAVLVTVCFIASLARAWAKVDSRLRGNDEACFCRAGADKGQMHGRDPSHLAGPRRALLLLAVRDGRFEISETDGGNWGWQIVDFAGGADIAFYVGDGQAGRRGHGFGRGGGDVAPVRGPQGRKTSGPEAACVDN